MPNYLAKVKIVCTIECMLNAETDEEAWGYVLPDLKNKDFKDWEYIQEPVELFLQDEQELEARLEKEVYTEDREGLTMIEVPRPPGEWV